MSDSERVGVGKPSSAETLQRRGIVKRLILEENITNREEIRRRLESDFGIVVTRQCVYNDFKSVAGDIPPEKVMEFQLDLLAIYRKRIRELDVMIDNAGSSREKLDCMKAQSMVMETMNRVANSLAVGGDNRWRVKKDDKERVEGVTLVFGNPRVRKEG